MIGPVEKKPSVRIAGYLEKRGKTRLVMCRWKRWWFVLEGRLLLYYKSQLEYLNLSPCRGSLNMGLASTVRPGKGLELTVVTRSQSVTLRAANKADHEQWLQSLLDAMALPHSNNNHSSRPFMHFRYFNQDQENLIERVRSFRNAAPYSVMTNSNNTSHTQSGSFETSTTSSSDSSSSERSRSDKCLLRRVFSDSRTLLERPYKRSADRSSARLGKIAFSDTAIPVSVHAVSLSPTGSSEKCQSMMELRNNLGVSCENVKGKETKHLNTETETPGSVGKESKLANSIKIELNLEDLGNTSGEIITEQKIGNIKIVLDGCTIYGSRKSSTEKEPVIKNNGDKTKRFQNFHICKTLNWSKNSKEVKSDSELSVVKQQTRAQSVSCENMQTLDRSIGSTYQDICTQQLQQERRAQHLVATGAGSKTNKRRSNSILRRFTVSKAEGEHETLERHRTIKKRLSFLRKVWKKREKKPEEEDFESIDYESIPVVIELPSPEVHKAEELLSSLRQEEMGPEPEPPPDYDTSISEELEVPPLLPPRQKLRRPNSPWHDVPKNNRPVLPPEDPIPPPLPVKTKNCKTHQVLIKIEQDSSSSIEQSLASSEFDSVLCQPPSQNSDQKLEDLDTLLVQLSEVNTFALQQIDLSQGRCVQSSLVQVTTEPEPDYDIPRPHMSLIATIRRQNAHKEEITATNFFCTTPLVDVDSLDPVTSRLDAEMTPDSLECDLPWSMSHSESQMNSHSDSSSGSLQYHFINADDKIFPDSLNS